MNYPERKVVRLSLCACGFPALKTEIPLGQVYQVPHYRLQEQGALICGGCGAEIPVRCILVLRDEMPMWLPMELFDWDDFETAPIYEPR